MKQKETLKAGCVIVNLTDKKIGLIYRQKQNDYEFPKGHLEFNETLEECAIRETAEETKRDVVIEKGFKPYSYIYTNKSKERCKCFYYLAVDQKHSDNDSLDTHTIIWKDIDEVDDILTYQSLKDVWSYFKPKIKKNYKF